MGIRLYYNPNCPDCVRLAALTRRLDWLDRVELRADKSPLGDVPVGEIVVVEKETGGMFSGIFAIRKACLQIPLFLPYGLILFLPPVLKPAGRRKIGCSGDACAI